MMPETVVEWAVLAGVLFVVVLSAATHRSPMGEPALIEVLIEWWRSRKD